MSDRFTIVKRGYDTNEVLVYIEKIENELKEIKGKEAAISKSLITAEMVASDIVKNAKEEAARILENARAEIGRELEAVEKMLASEKKSLADFCEEYDTIVKNYFTGSAADITAPLREKINMLEMFVKEAAMGKPDAAENTMGTASGGSNEQDGE